MSRIPVFPYPRIPSKITAVIFDMDGVLVDSMPFHCRAWKAVLESLGVPVEDIDIYLREGEKGEVTAGDYLEKAGYEKTPEKIQALLDRKEQLFKNIGKPHLFPQTITVLEKLKNSGYTLGLVTGTSYDEALKVLPKNLMSMFSAIVTGDRVSRGKPDPEPYLKALDLLSVDKNNAIVIENAPYGIRSAKSAGIYCIAVTSYLEKNYLSGADMFIESLDELLSIF